MRPLLELSFLPWLAVACVPAAVIEPDPDPPLSLVRTESYPGDAVCPGGTVEILTGLDDGTGNSTAGDGVLQEGEVLTRQSICQGGPLPSDPLDERFLPVGIGEGLAGSALVHAHGGSGVRGIGGNAGRIEARLFPPSKRGHLAVLPTGDFELEVVVPDATGVSLGAAPLVVSEDLVVVVSSGEDLDTGTPYLAIGSPTSLQRAGSSIGVTGLHVLPGVTLTLEGATNGMIDIVLGGSMLIEGTITTRGPTGSAVPLRFSCERWVSTPSSFIDLAGTSGGTESRGTAGGAFTVVAFAGMPQRPVVLGSVVAEGTIDVRGGTGTTGGAGGEVRLEAYERVVGRLMVNTQGGDATGVGTAGSGGRISLIAQRGPVAFDLDGTTKGGSSHVQAGIGGHLTIDGYGVTVLGTMLQDGGSTTGCASSCDAGAGGGAAVTSRGAPLRWKVDMHSVGGSSTDTPGGLAGNGGGAVFRTQSTTEVVPSSSDRSVLVGGSFVLDGGSGEERGSNAGSLQLYVEANLAPESTLRMVGYTSISLIGGGSTQSDGGSGGTVSLQHASEDPSGEGGGTWLATPANLSAGRGATGGSAGFLRVESTLSGGEASPLREAAVLAPITAWGGEGSAQGGAGPLVSIRGTWGARLGADLIGGGGLATRSSGIGGSGSRTGGVVAPILIESGLGTVVVEGDLSLPGATSGLRGGSGATVLLQGPQVVVRSAIDLHGGDAPAGDGGNGGSVHARTRGDALDLTGASFDLGGGDGVGKLGTNGRLFVDGVDQTDALLP